MTTKEWLNRGFDIWRRLEVKKAYLETLGNVVSRYGEREIETYHAENVSEVTFIKWSETKKEVNQLESKLFDIDQVTKKAIERLHNPNEYAVLYCRYIMRKNWKDVAKICDYSEPSMFRLHREGVEHLGAVAYDLIEEID
jgi:DNA-directed RNA polymerase specialized sigma subunit